MDYNEKFGIVPETIIKAIRNPLVEKVEEEKIDEDSFTPQEAKKYILVLNKQMRELAKIFEFEKAAKIRDKILGIKKQFNLE
jgi:excinuclease ABC subunit B